MRVFLVYTDVSSNHGLAYHPGLASIGAVLLQEGHEVKLGYIDDVDQYQGIVDSVDDFDADVVGFTTVETQFSHVQRISAMIKARRDCVIICGGTHMTLAPESLLEDASKSLDGIMRGECEYAFSELVDRIGRNEEYYDVSNLAYLHPETRRLIQNPLRPAIDNLEELPHPATELFPYQSIIDDHNTALFHFSRGCPFPCTYCSARVLMTQYGQKIRYRSVDSTIEEIKLVVERYDLKASTSLMIADDLFSINKNWLDEFLPRYEKEIGLPFSANIRSNVTNETYFEKMAAAGCRTVLMSVESGNDYIRNEVMKRGITREKMFKSFEWAKKAGVNTNATCIIGLPFETPAMIENSIETLAQLDAIEYGINIFYPYKGTALRTICEENGFMPDVLGREANDIKDVWERKESILNLPTITKDEILHYQQNWESLISSQKAWKVRTARKIRNSYGDFFYAKKRFPIVRSFLEKNQWAYKAKRLVSKTLGF